MAQYKIRITMFMAIGLLAGLLISSNALAAEKNILFILDASGSMAQKFGDQTRMQAAKDAFDTLLADLPEGVDVGMEAYGHHGNKDCSVIEVMNPVGPLDTASIKANVQSLSPKHGATPMAAALEQGAKALKVSAGEKSIVLISDGKETCGGDPAAMAKKLRGKGFDITTHVVGLGVNADETAQLAAIAAAGHGKYYAANNADELKQALAVINEKLGKPQRTVAKATDIVFEDTFTADFLGPDWSIMDENPDNIVMDEGVLVITQPSKKVTDKAGKVRWVHPNTLVLKKELPKNYEITVEWEVDFKLGKWWGQEIGLWLVSEKKDDVWTGVRYGDFSTAGMMFYLGRFINKTTSGNTTKIVDKGKDLGRGLGLQKVQVRLLKKKFDFTSYVRITGEDWKKVGTQKIIKFRKPQLRLMQYNWGGPETEARIKHITIRKVE